MIFVPLHRAACPLTLCLLIKTPLTKDLSYIFTDFQSNDNLGSSVAQEYAAAAQRRGCLFIPVVLDCVLEENARRMRSAERVELERSGKGLLLDTSQLGEMRGRVAIYRFRCPEQLELDVSDLNAEEAARVIAEHIRCAMQKQLSDH